MIQVRWLVPFRAPTVLFAALLSSVVAAEAQETGTLYDPPISTVVDSAALVRAVAELRLPPLPRNVRPMFSIYFDSTGAGRVLEIGDLPSGYAEPVATAIRAHLLPRGPGRPVSTHLRVVGGAKASMDRPALREEMPRLLNQAVFRRELVRVGRLLGQRNLGEVGVTYYAEVRLRVLETGEVDGSSVELARSTGLVAADQELVQAVHRLRFRPATLEGRPVRAWVNQPVTITIEAAQPREGRDTGSGWPSR